MILFPPEFKNSKVSLFTEYKGKTIKIIKTINLEYLYFKSLLIFNTIIQKLRTMNGNPKRKSGAVNNQKTIPRNDVINKILGIDNMLFFLNRAYIKLKNEKTKQQTKIILIEST